MIRVKERTVTFRVNSEEVIFAANSTPHYSNSTPKDMFDANSTPKDMVGCFIVQVLDNANEKIMVSESKSESSIELTDEVYIIALAFEMRLLKIVALRKTLLRSLYDYNCKGKESGS